VIADVHGNSWALAAVIADAQQCGAGRVFDLGDRAYGPLDPAGAMAQLERLQAVAVRGNQDRIDLASPTGDTGQFVAGSLTPQQRDRLRRLPPTRTVDGVLLCHGTPSDDTAYLLEEITPVGRRARSPVDVARLLADVNEPVILCAHTHIARQLALPDGRQVVNPGSVGLPAYHDDAPYPHLMESGTPQARYALLHRTTGSQWRCEFRSVDYPWAEAAAAARQRGREDWAAALETGLSQPSIDRREHVHL
jgi:diadenosine tetraphosphatase ApaH/serine/threonine PP2A family protein phosphatase